MKPLLLSIALFVGSLHWTDCQRSQAKRVWACPRVAVYEHVPQGNHEKQSPREIINRNLEEYVKAVRMAAQEEVQLIVFPEDSLLNCEEYSRKQLINEILEEMPSTEQGDPLVNPCFSTEDTAIVNANESVLRTMSCLARSYRMYVALSFGDKVRCSPDDTKCPPDGHYLYNTVGLFDDQGNFVVKYHKMQLYYEFHYNIPSDCPKHPNHVVYYDSPFGRLGFLICYDIMWYSPGIDLVEKHGVDTLIYPTYFFNYMPFVSAVQMQQAYALVHRVNFLGSSTQVPSNGTVGSGIFSAKGALAYSNEADGKCKLIIANIPRDSKNAKLVEKCAANPKKVVVFEQGRPNHINLQLNPALVKLIPMKHAFGQEYIEHCCPRTGICCSLCYKVRNIAQFHREHFVLIVGSILSGALGQERYPIRQEFCGVAACNDRACSSFAMTSKTKFRAIDLRTHMKSTYIYPGVMTDRMGLLPLEQWNVVTIGQGERQLQVFDATEPLVAVTLYGRWYEKDPEYKH